MYAQLGTTIFDNLKGFTDYSKSGEATYAQHDVITGKPLLEATGLNLDEITLSIRLHVSFCKPAEELASLKSQRDSLAPLSLIWGNGKVEGKFVVTSLSERVEDADAQGNVFSYTIDLTLREYIETDPLRAAKIQSVKNASAVGDKKPVAKKKTNKPPCANENAKEVTSIQNNAKQIDVIIKQKGGVFASANNRQTVIGYCIAIKTRCQTIIKNVDDANNCAHEYPLIKDRALRVIDAAQTMIAHVQASADFAIYADNNTLQDWVKQLRVEAYRLIQKSITNG